MDSLRDRQRLHSRAAVRKEKIKYKKRKNEKKRRFSSILILLFLLFIPILSFSLSLSPPSSCRNNAIYNLTQEEEEEEEENTGPLNSFQTVHWEQQLSKSGCGAYHSLSTLAAAAALRMKTLDERWEKERRPRESHAAGNRLFVLPTQTHTQKGTERRMKSEGDRSVAVTKRNRQKGAPLKHLHYYDTPQSDTYWHFKHLPWRWKANTRIYPFYSSSSTLKNRLIIEQVFLCLLLFKIK